MDRLATILIVAGSLLWCPLHCSGAASGDCVESGRDASSHGCSCCQHHQPIASPDDDSRPLESPVKDCNCGNCLCHGAVLSDDAPADSLVDNAFVLALEFPQLVEFSHHPVGHPLAWNDPLICSGIDVCILHQSLLL